MGWKLARAWTPEALAAWSGPPGRLARIPKLQYVPYLEAKLLEEFGEYLIESDPAELADVYDVVVTLGEVLHVDLAAMARSKREVVGPLGPLIWTPDAKDPLPGYAKEIER